MKLFNKHIRNIVFGVGAVMLLFAGCTGRPRVSYDVAEVFRTPRFNSVTLVDSEIAVLPLMSREGIVEDSEFGAPQIFSSISAMRPDLNFTPHENFESAFPPRFDRRRFKTFYGQIFRDELDSLVAQDSLWEFIAQPHFIVFMLRDGAQIQNVDDSHFKHINLVCEIWSRETRRVLWRTSCRAVSDDKGVKDRTLISECVHRTMMLIPVAAPTTTGKPIPPGVIGGR